MYGAFIMSGHRCEGDRERECMLKRFAGRPEEGAAARRSDSDGDVGVVDVDGVDDMYRRGKKK